MQKYQAMQSEALAQVPVGAGSWHKVLYRVVHTSCGDCRHKCNHLHIRPVLLNGCAANA